MDLWTGLLLGLGMGVLSGLGVGGGKLLIPALVFFFSIGQTQAQGIVLMAFIPIAAIAAYVHYKEGHVQVRPAILVAAGGVVGALIGSYLATSMPAFWLKRAYGLFLLAVAIYEMFSREGTT